MNSDIKNDENKSSGDELDFAIVHNNRQRQTDETGLEYPYEVLSTEEIVQHMVDCVKEVNTIVQIPATTTHTLLNHFKWDKEKLMEQFYDGDQDQLFAEARLINPFRKCVIQKPKQPRWISSSGTEECEICCCCTVLPTSIMTGLECGHTYCTECWCKYLTTKIMKEGLGQTISCAAHACDMLVDVATVMRLVRDPCVKLKYQIIITNSFVECNRLLRWCPSPDCSNAIKVAYVEAAPVTCRCGHTFCFACEENWHYPVRCCLLRKWIKKCANDDDETQTLNWIAAYTKDCPWCGVFIEKCGGCNHMTCKNCKAEFCWLCLKRPYALHNCNRFEGDEAKAQRPQAVLERYRFFCTRHMNHKQSLHFESKLYAAVKVKMEEIQKHNYMTWVEVQFLKKAVDILYQCRQTLMYTYVFAYYLRKNNQSVIFEDNQRDLESATETLSEYLERDITSENLADIKQKVLDKYGYCDRRRKVLLEHVQEGYEEEWWEWNTD